MPWLRVSDTAGNHPVVLEPLTDPAPPPPMDPFLWADAVFGVVIRAATSAAGYSKSYIVTDATVAGIAGPSWRAVAEAAERAGYWTRHEPGGWCLLDDAENFIHIRRAEEIAWERARKADAADPRLTAAVRLRDGDGCRYCGVIVSWGDSRSARGGTYDHRTPGRSAEGPEDLRVACRRCNAQRGDRPDADTFLPPKAPPCAPHYSDRTAAFLAERGHDVTATQTPAPAGTRPGSQPDTAPRDLAASETPRTHHATPQPAGHRTPARPATADPAPPVRDRAPNATTQPPTATDRSADHADRRTTEDQSPGRVGPGAGRAGTGSRTPNQAPARRTRGRRGRSNR